MGPPLDQLAHLNLVATCHRRYVHGIEALPHARGAQSLRRLSAERLAPHLRDRPDNSDSRGEQINQRVDALQLRFVDPGQVKSIRNVVCRRHEPGGKVPEAAHRTIAQRSAAGGAAGPADGLCGSRCVGAGALRCEAKGLRGLDQELRPRALAATRRGLGAAPTP